MCLVPCDALHPQSLASSKREVDLEGRLTAIINALTSDVYSYTCLGLFERHKLMLSFQLAVKILETGPQPLDPQVRAWSGLRMAVSLASGSHTKCTVAFVCAVRQLPCNG